MTVTTVYDPMKRSYYKIIKAYTPTVENDDDLVQVYAAPVKELEEQLREALPPAMYNLLLVEMLKARSDPVAPGKWRSSWFAEMEPNMPFIEQG